MTKDELIAILRLQNIPHIGDITAKEAFRKNWWNWICSHKRPA